jgi:prepilin-type processing-associated H-X9-DG protein
VGLVRLVGPRDDAINFNDGDDSDQNGVNSAQPNCKFNWSFQIITINTFLCPSDSDGVTYAPGSQAWNTSPKTLGHNNYSGNSGSSPWSFWCVTGTFDGLFKWVGGTIQSNGAARPGTPAGQGSASAIGFATVTDGLSNTAAFSEKVMGFGTNNNQRRNLLSVFAVSAPGNGDPTAPTASTIPPLSFYNQCKAINIQTAGLASQSPNGFYYMTGYPSATRYNHIMPPNTQSCSWNGDAGYGAITASSHHSGGVNMSMADGSVRFAKNSVNLTAWWAIGTRAGGEVVSADAF